MSAGEPMLCYRCKLAMTLEPFSPGSLRWGWYCSCCKSRMVTPALSEANADRIAEARGVTVAELREEGRKLIRTEPLPPAELERVAAWFTEQADEWTPACEHDTKNPWEATA